MDNYSVASELSQIEDKSCPPWSLYDTTNNQCMCYDSPTAGLVYCTDEGNFLFYGFCMTYDEENDIVSLSYCIYYEVDASHHIAKHGYIRLPNNISELSEYVCGPMNRKGRVCSECIDGYGPSVTFLRYRCVECKSIWYGISLYLIIEVVPVTIFYIVVLLFQLNLTSAPTISFIMYSNFVITGVLFLVTITNEARPYATFITLLYGVWTLDFIRYAIPPLCISPTLKIEHIIYLQSLSIVLPYVYIVVTWILIKLYSRNCKAVAWMWKILNKTILKHRQIKWNSGRTVVDAFATFFLLSFAKATSVLLLPLDPLQIQQINNNSLSFTVNSITDPSQEYLNNGELPLLVLSLGGLLFYVLLPLLFIAFYPLKCFRALLSKCLCSRYICILNIFVEKYYSCYKDGLDGSRDMRSFASMYFLLILISSLVVMLVKPYLLTLTLLFVGCSILILIVQPYKKRYMANVDSLILANLGLLTFALNKNIYASIFYQLIVSVSVVLPGLGLIAYICFRLLKNRCSKLLPKVRTKMPSFKSRLLCCMRANLDEKEVENGQQQKGNDTEDIDLPDRVLHPEVYAVTEENIATY